MLTAGKRDSSSSRSWILVMAGFAAIMFLVVINSFNNSAAAPTVAAAPIVVQASETTVHKLGQVNQDHMPVEARSKKDDHLNYAPAEWCYLSSSHHCCLSSSHTTATLSQIL